MVYPKYDNSTLCFILETNDPAKFLDDNPEVKDSSGLKVVKF
jgi:hypothetical protein